MVQALPDMTSSSLQETQKQRKKQAKRESKLRLKIEEAKGEVRQAEQKMAKARLAYELATTRLHTLEDEYNKMRNDSAAS